MDAGKDQNPSRPLVILFTLRILPPDGRGDKRKKIRSNHGMRVDYAS